MSQDYSNVFVQILHEMNRVGNFSLSVLFDKEGFAIASADADHNHAERQAATLAVLQKNINQIKDHVGLNNTEEFVVFDDFGQRLVCRSFSLNKQPMTLAVVVRNKNQPYRKVMNTAIRKISESLI